MTIVRRILLALLAVLVLACGTIVALRAGVMNTDREALKVKWAQAPSRFVTVDGVPMHVREEGRGPIVVLVHGSISNLHEWDQVTERLKGHYRVVRFDWTPYGLSGPDPTGVYTTARAADLMDGLMRALGHDRFALVSTSNGANVALEYNRRHPGHATAMAFSMLPLERPSQTRKVNPWLKQMVGFHKTFVPNWHPHAFYRMVLKDTTPPTFEPTVEMVDQLYDMNNLPDAAAQQAAYIASNTRLFKTRDVGAVAETVTVPVLLQWCNYDNVISQSPEASIRRFTHTKVELIEYPQLGHFPMWENPDLFTRDLARFLDKVTVSSTL